MKILVTGANGQLGNEMRILARETNDTYIFTDVNDTYIFTDVTTPEGVETTLLDITDLEAVRRLVKEQGVQCIVNCAAYTNVDKAETDEAFCRTLNAKAPQNLAIAMKEVNGLLVHVSTDYVFGGDPYNIPCREDQQGTPTGIYGQTKLEGEEFIRQSGCDHVILRTAWLYSEFGKNFVKTMLNLTATKPQLNVVFDQAGTPTYAYDLAAAIVTILRDYEAEQPSAGYSKTGIYHYSNEGVCSWYDRPYFLRYPALPQQRVPQSRETSGLFGARQDQDQGNFRASHPLLDGIPEGLPLPALIPVAGRQKKKRCSGAEMRSAGTAYID